MSKLPIENHPELLQEYGRAIAWFNMAESYLNMVLLVKGGLIKSNVKLVNQILDGMMVGKKISLAGTFLRDELIKKLWKLNSNRVLLAHGVTGEKVPSDNPKFKTGQFSIQHNQKDYPFTKEILAETINLAKELSVELHKEVISKSS
ncbi:MAG: hypothetical protein WCT46_01270 [Candidatus Gracilibacteria bacterium]|jgi:hypothetical protein